MAKTKKQPTNTEGKPLETKQQKLFRLAQKRVERACKYISLCGNLAAYKPTEAETTKIVAALAESCQRVEARLMGSRKDSFTFTLQ